MLLRSQKPNDTKGYENPRNLYNPINPRFRRVWGAVGNADRIWASTPQNRTYRVWGLRHTACAYYYAESPLLKGGLQRRQVFDYLHGLQTDGDDAGDEIDDIPRFRLTVRVVNNPAPFVRFDTILVYYPLQR